MLSRDDFIRLTTVVVAVAVFAGVFGAVLELMVD